MKFIKVTLIMLMLVFATSAMAAVNVNFRNMEMIEFVTFVSEFTGKNFVYDEKDVKGNITIESSSEINSRDIMKIFSSALRANGLELVDRGTFTAIVRQNDINDIDDSEGTGDENALITTVLTARNYDVKVLVTALARIKSKTGFVDVLKGLNGVVVRDRIERIAKIKSLMERLELKAEGFNLNIVKIEHASAESVETALKKMYADLEKKLLISSEPVIVADAYSNSLIIASEAVDLAKIKYIISQIDTETTGTHNAPKVFYLNNANAEDIQKVLDKLTGVENSSQEKGKKAPTTKSSVAYDKSTNSIIVFGDPDLYTKVEDLIKKLDIPRQQVYVEALILETTLESGSDFGVEWLAGAGNSSEAGTVGYLNSSGNLQNFMYGGTGGAPNQNALAGGFNLGVLGNIVNFNGLNFPTLGLLANFIKTSNGINIVSNPQLLTLDNEEAEVFVGENRPFVTDNRVDSNGNNVQSYDYRDVGVKLKIVPQISSNDTVTLQIEQEVKKVTASAGAETLPVTLTRSTKTKVKLQDGSIMVISGLLKDDSEKYNSAVPGFSRIPILGWLFKTKAGNAEKTNMMVFISTHIIRTAEQAKALTEKKQKESAEFKQDVDQRIRKEFK